MHAFSEVNRTGIARSTEPVGTESHQQNSHSLPIQVRTPVRSKKQTKSHSKNLQNRAKIDPKSLPRASLEPSGARVSPKSARKRSKRGLKRPKGRTWGLSSQGLLCASLGPRRGRSASLRPRRGRSAHRNYHRRPVGLRVLIDPGSSKRLAGAALRSARCPLRIAGASQRLSTFRRGLARAVLRIAGASQGPLCASLGSRKVRSAHRWGLAEVALHN